MGVNRRDFLRGAAGAASAAAFAGATSLISAETSNLPAPAASNIEHIIVVMMENRSFDHFFGWLPGANGKQAGLTYVDSNGESHPTQRLTTFVGCAHPDPDHSYARNFTTCDNYFASILSSTFPNRIFQHAAQTDRLSNTFDISTLPTIWDNLAAAGVSAKYYWANVPFLALWGTKYIDISDTYAQFLLDAANGNLPAVSFVDPAYTILDDGEGNDDHPHADIRSGEAFISQIYNAVTNGPGWKNTVLIFNRDEWGGFYDTVAPPRVIAANALDTDIVDGKTLLGCRVPVVIASPFSMGKPATPRIDSHLYDHTSVLKLIEWRYNLPPLTPRDASTEISNLALALNFKATYTAPPSIPVTTPPIPTPCGLFELGSEVDNESYDFYKMLNSDLMTGWL
jgi:phospholipase C